MAEKIQFFPLDITYKVVDDKPVIYLFGKTTAGEQICVVDDTFEPYLIVVPKKGKAVKEKLEKIKVEIGDVIAEVTKTEIVNKKYLGNDVEAIKVYTKVPADIPVIRDTIKDWEILESVNEYDVLFERRYLVDKGITMLTLVEAEGDFITQRSKVPVLRATSVKQFSDDSLTKPRILAFDIETYNPLGKTMEPEKYPVIMISFYGERYKKVITWKRFKTKESYIEFVDGEAELIERFKEVIEQYKPDILTGYFSDGFDFPYIRVRAKKYKIKVDIGLDYSELKIRKRIEATQISGINHLDVFKYIIKIMSNSLETDTYGLSSVAEELLNEKKREVDLDELSEAWDKKPEKLEGFCKYNLHDSYLTFKLAEKLLPNLIELVKIVGLPIYDINRMGFSQLVEWYLIKQTKNFNEIILNRPNHDEIRQRRLQTYKGAFVYEPTPGLYKNIVVFDYRSLYPTIISSHNISLETLNCKCCEGKAEATPTEGKEKYWFCKKKKGFIPAMIEDIITRRMRIKEMIKENKSSVFFSAREQSLKLMANSFYGYLGFFAARWYSVECAKSVTAWGRFYIHKVIDKAKDSGFNVLYSDTDSVFLLMKGKKVKDVKKFAESVNVELPGLMELEYEGRYPSGIFVSAKETGYGAKKKYALLTETGNIKIKGFEAVRRNWSIIAKEVQQEVLKIVLKENNKEKAMKYTKRIIDDLRNNKVALDKVIIHTQLQKEIGDYDNVGPHVAVAKKLREQGLKIAPGTVIKYIVTKGKGLIRDRAMLPDEIKQKDYDPVYYVNNQIIPAVEKIFSVLGYHKSDLTEKKGQEKLGKFFG